MGAMYAHGVQRNCRFVAAVDQAGYWRNPYRVRSTAITVKSVDRWDVRRPLQQFSSKLLVMPLSNSHKILDKDHKVAELVVITTVWRGGAHLLVGPSLVGSEISTPWILDYWPRCRRLVEAIKTK